MRGQAKGSASANVAALIASALDDKTTDTLLNALGVSPLALLGSQNESKAFINRLVEATERPKRLDLERRLAPVLMDKYSFVRYQADGSSTDKRGYTVYIQTSGMLSYQRPNMLQLKREILELGGTWLEDDEQEKILYAILSATPVVSEIERRFFAISKSLYWDNKTASLVPAVPKGHRCFIRLFDSKERHGGGVVYYPAEDFNESFSKLIKTEYTSLLTELRGLPAPIHFADIVAQIPRSFHFIEEWADLDPGVYWDIMTLISTVFMRNKPLGAYFLIGLSRNGKSSEICHNMLVLAKRNRGEPADRCSNNNTYDTSSQWQFIRHGDLRPGDYVMSWEGTPTKVTHIWPQDSKPCYRLTLQDGRTVEASNTHQWAVVPTHRLAGHRPRVRDEHGRVTHKRRTVPIKRYDPDMWEIKTTEEMVRDFVDSRGRPKWHIPPAHPVCLPERTLPIDPYTLGIIIGDAYIYPFGKVRMTGQDPTLIETVIGRPPRVDKKRTALSKAHIIAYDGSTVRFEQELKALGLAGTHAYDKFIPEEYLMGSISQRYALLRGLLDTDGTISHGAKNGKLNQVEFSTASKKLAEQVRSLVFSLGGTATVHERMGRYKLPDGTYKETRPNYRLFIRTLENPFTLPRKAKYWHPQKRLGYTAITKIEYIGEEPCQCITVDAPSHLYQVTPYFIPTHNCVNMLHSIFGTANTSRTKLSKMGDPHHAAPLEWSILNAPDDEEDDITQYQGAFKELAGHQTYDATKLYSGTPLRINGANLTFVFPMNTLPMWKGTSASACSKRTVPIPFLHSFDSSDTKTNNFEQTTYTRDTLGRVAAQAMALATFYEEHPEAFGYSTTSMSQKQAIQEDNDSVSAYKRLFNKYFGGFQTWELLYTDYCCWCQQKEFRYMPRNSLILAFQEYKSEKYRMNKAYPTASGRASKKCRRSVNSNPKAHPLMPDLYLLEFKRDVNSLHDSGLSAVYELEEYYGANYKN